jgi:hypothetical protein
MPNEDNHIQVATDPAFTNIVLDVSGYIGLSELSGLLAAGQTYYWRQTLLVGGQHIVIYHGRLMGSQAADLVDLYNTELVPFIQEYKGEEVEPLESVVICHIPPGNPAQARTKEIPIEDLDDHLGHGDHEGACTDEDYEREKPGPPDDKGRPDDPGSGRRNGLGKNGEVVPAEYELGQNYPNPFSTLTTIPLSLPVASRVRVSIHNLLGQQLEVFIDSELPAGRHQFIWNGSDFPAGSYLVTVEAGSFRKSQQITLTK